MVTKNGFVCGGHGGGERMFDSTWRQRCAGDDDSCCSCCIGGFCDDRGRCGSAVITRPRLRAVGLDGSCSYSGHVPCTYAGRPIATALRAGFPFCGHAADRRGAVHTHAANCTGTGVFIWYFSTKKFSQKLYSGCGDDDDEVCVFTTSLYYNVPLARRSQRPAWTSDGWCSGGVLRRSRRTRSWPLLL